MASYAFTVLSFLTGIVGLVLALRPSRKYQKFKGLGGESSFLTIYCLAFIVLAALLIVSIMQMREGVDLVDWMLVLTACSLLQVAYFVVTLWNLSEGGIERDHSEKYPSPGEQIEHDQR